MANIIIRRTVSLDGPVLPEFMAAPLYNQENQAHQFVITTTREGAEEALTGTVQGRFIRPDGSTVLLTGSISAGRAVVTLPQAAYYQVGRFIMSIMSVADSKVTVIYAATGHIARSLTGTTVDPGSVVPDITQLLAEIDEMREATAAAEAAAAGIGQYVIDGYLNASGSIVTDSSVHSIYTEKMKCAEGDVFFYSGRSVNNAVSWIMYNGNSIVRTKNYSGTVSNKIIIIPPGVNLIQFASLQVSGRFPFAVIREANAQTVYGYIATHRTWGYVVNATGATATGVSEGGIYIDEGFNSIYSDKISCVEGDVFIYTGRSMTNVAAAVFYNGSTVVGTYTGKGSEYELPITIPAGVDGVVFNSYCTTDNGLAQLRVEEPGWGALWKKSIIFLGDSYIANNGQPFADTWAYKLGRKYNMTVTNAGINGNGMVSGSNPMSERYTSLSSDADYVVVVGGTNDFNNQMAISTFKANLETFVQGLISKYPTSKLAFFTIWNGLTNTSPAGGGAKTYEKGEYNDAIVEVCGKYGVPVYDSWRRSGMWPFNASFRSAYFQGANDWSHLNAAGHDRFLPQADAFLNSI